MSKPSNKKIAGYVKLQVLAGSANPAPPVGPALGQKGVNIMEFCKAFNAATTTFPKDAKITVLITCYADRSFTFELKGIPVTYYILKAAGLSKGAKAPGREVVGSVTMDQLRGIAKEKMESMGLDTEEAALSSLRGSALSMGIKVVS